ncbi:DUF5977 domain-containing protein [Flavobacterium sp. RS13.1]|uniref:DUF5977 domain-containing protein n=1 Tax=Flavobacterium sp. RS13.1 TaxID=3400345 RepID=UPI003AABCB90
MMKKIFLLVIFVSNISIGQERFNLESLIPPAPNAAELGKYGTYPVGTLTGIPEISFPLYEIKSGSLSLPISLSYHASGVQVNQKATDVGLGWSVIAGGQISRTVYSAKDEGQYGYFNYNPPSAEALHNTFNYFTLANYNIVGNVGYDLQPDLFVYNIGGKSGKFFCNKNKNFVTVPFDPIKIQKTGTTTVTFQITDDNGTIYKFDKFSSTLSDFGIQRNIPSTWYLTSITSADLTDTISFEYDTVLTNEYVNMESQSIGKKYYSPNDGLPQFVNEQTTTHSEIAYTELLVKKITFKGGYVLFNRNTPRKDNLGNNLIYSLDEILIYTTTNQLVKKIQFNHDYYYSPNGMVVEGAKYRLKLTGFTESGSDTTNKKEYKFDYDGTTLPSFGSFNMDYWGFYNGASNFKLIPTTTVYARDINSVTYVNTQNINNGFMNPFESWTIGGANREPSETYMKAGILTKITYPTGGYSLFEFEPHKYPSSQYFYQSISKVCGPTFGINRFSKKTEVTNFTYLATGANESIIPAYISINFSASGMINTDEGETQMVTLTNTTTNTIIKTWKHEGDLTIPRSVTEQIFIASGENYTLKNEIYGPNTVSIKSSISWNEKTLQPVVKIGGGLRIKSLKNYSHTNILAKEENYIYGENESGLGTKLFDERYFYRNYEDIGSAYYTPVGGTTSGGACAFIGEAWVRNFFGISVYNSINHMGSSILYPTVTKYEGTPTLNSGKTEYDYNIIINTRVPSEEFLSSSPYGSITNIWNQGELISETTFTKQGTEYIPATKKLYEYSTYNHSTENSLLFKQSTQYVPFGPCSWLPDGPSGGQGFFSIQEYPITTGISKKIKETQIVYDQTNPANAVTSVTSYQYQNADNRYMTETSITNSDGRTHITRIKYPQDMSDAVSTAMIAKNILTPPLEEKTFKSISGTETPLSTIQTTYKKIGDLIVRDTIKASKGTNTPEPRIVFNQYDNEANIIEQQKIGGASQVFIWGYQKSLPIAKIENISYANIPASLISAVQTASDSGTENDLLNALTILRNDPALAYAMVTTYTYIPLVGVSTITDPKGDITTYTYDTFGRLQFVKDKNFNILQKYCYNYKGQQIDCDINLASGVVYKSTARSGSFTRNNCASGGAGSSVSYSQAEGVETSTISQADADALGLSRFNNDGQAYANTNGICTLPLPAAPTGLTLTSKTTTSLNFSWTAVAGATSYKIYKNGQDIGITTSVSTGSLSGLTPDTAYNIQVLAVNAAGDGALSTAVSMRTDPTIATNACVLEFQGTIGSCKVYKNGTAYISRTTTGISSGTLTTGDTFHVTVTASNIYYKGITIISSVRGILYNYAPNKTGASATSPTFTKEGSEEIEIYCYIDRLL